MSAEFANTNARLTAAREAAWNGRHAEAIALCTRALGEGGLDPAAEIDFLDTRAESYHAQADFAAAMSDVEQMAAYAYGEEDPALIAQVLNRKAIIQMRLGRLDEAIATATEALAAATAAGNQKLVATSYLRLGEAQFRSGMVESAHENSLRAMKACADVGDIIGQGRALVYLVAALTPQGQIKEALHYTAEARRLLEHAGDRYGLGNLFNHNSQFLEEDLARRLQLLRRALTAFQECGYVDRQAMVVGNIGTLYGRLGLHRRSRRYLREAIDLSVEIGARVMEGRHLGTLAVTEMFIGDLDGVRLTHERMAALLKDMNDPGALFLYYAGQGWLAILENRTGAALGCFQDALNLAESKGFVASQIAARSWLGDAYLAHGDPESALTAITAAIDQHQDYDFASMVNVDPNRIWWTYAQALTANGRTQEAQRAAARAYEFLLTALANVRDVGLRRNYLNKNDLTGMRAMLRAWVSYDSEHGLADEPLFAHLQIESDPREPFQRLADTGLRLNALRTQEELFAFLVEEATELSGGERVLLILEENGRRRIAYSLFPAGEEAGPILAAQAVYFDSASRTRTAQLYVPDNPRDIDALSRIIAPLIAQNDLLGYLYVDMAALFGVFDETDRDMIGMLANQGAVALQNVRWTETLEQRVRARTVELETINEIGQGLLANLDLDGILAVVGETVQQRFGAENIIIAFARPESETVVAPYIVLDGTRQEPNEVPAVMTLTAQVMRQGEPLLISSLEEAQTYPYLLPGQLRAAGKGGWSSLGVPLRRGADVVGALIISDRRDGAFDDSHVRLLTTIAANMGMALEKTRLFEEAQAARQAAEEASRTKSAFLANMSHELRTPLNAIIGFTRIVRRKGGEVLPEKQLANLDKVLVSSDHLLGLINTVLDIAKIEAGRMEVHPRAFSLGPLAEQLLATSQPLVKKGVTLAGEIPNDLPQLHTDPEKLKQILLNLLSNAAKFTHEGEITLRARAEDGFLYVDVADTGIGMPPEAVGRIFEEFQQVDSSTTREYGGTGLGLSISQRLARLLGGDLSAVSEEGRGSTFTLTIPVQFGEAS